MTNIRKPKGHCIEFESNIDLALISYEYNNLVGAAYHLGRAEAEAFRQYVIELVRNENTELAGLWALRRDLAKAMADMVQRIGDGCEIRRLASELKSRREARIEAPPSEAEIGNEWCEAESDGDKAA